MATKDDAGARLLTRGDVFNALVDDKTIKMSTEFGTDVIKLKKRKPYITATINGKGAKSVSDIMLVYGSYHYQFGTNVLFPVNVKDL